MAGRDAHSAILPTANCTWRAPTSEAPAKWIVEESLFKLATKLDGAKSAISSGTRAKDQNYCGSMTIAEGSRSSAQGDRVVADNP